MKNKNNSILLENKDMNDGKIPKKSRIKIGNIFTLQKDLAVKQVGKIDSKKINKVIDSITKLIS
ncbi:MAG: hypothetical protein MAG458_01709 [Nitrosopumilus sp.]|nr:hypothetical protein [Nitrosopumilus sp.]